MRYFFKFLVVLFFANLLLACSDQHQKRQAIFQSWMQSNGKIKVLSTTAMIDDLVKKIGGQYVDTFTLIQGQLDPHSYQLVKGDDEKLGFAQLIFYNGLELEHGPSLQRYLHTNTHAFALGDYIFQQNPAEIIYIKGQKDPHIWMDISLWAQTVPLVVKVLAEKDPIHAAAYEANAKQLVAEMQEIHTQVKNIMHKVPEDKRYMVTSHDAFNYFTRAYLAEENELSSSAWQKRFEAPEGLAPESQLSTANIREIIDHLKQHHIHLLFSESNVSQDSIKKIMQAGNEQGLEISIACCPLYGDAMGAPGSEADSYLKMIIYNAQTLASHMYPSLMQENNYNHSN